jgi:hypothetical protein
MRILVAAIATVLLAGCTTSPVSSGNAAPVPASRALAYQAPVAGGAAFVVTRDTGWMAGGGCYAAVLIDGKIASRMGTGETAKFHVAPGRHIIGMSGDAEGGGLCAMQIAQPVKESAAELRPGEIQKFRISGDTNGLDIRPTSL